MARPKGSTNKAKDAKALLDKVAAEYAKQGKKLDFTISDIADLSDEQKTIVAEAAANNPDILIPDIFELSGAGDDDDDDDTASCGNCGADDLDGDETHCPHCGVKLEWE